MNVSKQIKELARHQDVTLTELAEKLNTSQGNLTNKLSRDKFRINEIQEISNALGFTNMEILLRGSKEDAVIFKDKVEYKPHNVYMMFDKDKDLLQDIDENGFRSKRFKDLVFDVVEEKLKPLSGDVWDAYIPIQSEDIFKPFVESLLMVLSVNEEGQKIIGNALSSLMSNSKEE